MRAGEGCWGAGWAPWGGREEEVEEGQQQAPRPSGGKADAGGSGEPGKERDRKAKPCCRRPDPHLGQRPLRCCAPCPSSGRGRCRHHRCGHRGWSGAAPHLSPPSCTCGWAAAPCPPGTRRWGWSPAAPGTPARRPPAPPPPHPPAAPGTAAGALRRERRALRVRAAQHPPAAPRSGRSQLAKSTEPFALLCPSPLQPAWDGHCPGKHIPQSGGNQGTGWGESAMPPASQQGVLGDTGVCTPARRSRHLSGGEQQGAGKGCTRCWVAPAAGCPQLAGRLWETGLLPAQTLGAVP